MIESAIRMSSDSTALPHIWPRCQEEASREGDAAGLAAQSYHQHYCSVRRYAYAIVHRLPEAEDIAQECYVRLLQTLERGVLIECPLAWLLRVAHNLALDRIGQMPAEVPFKTNQCEMMPCPDPNPEQATLVTEERTRIRLALSRLSAQELRCWMLRSEGMRYREIADILGIRTGTVATFLVRATEKLVAGA